MAQYELHAIGTEIYYTGDMANQPARGEVVKHRHSTDWGGSLDIRLEDGRECKGIQMSNFSGPGRRFILWTEYQTERERQIEEMRAYYAKMFPVAATEAR